MDACPAHVGEILIVPIYCLSWPVLISLVIIWNASILLGIDRANHNIIKITNTAEITMLDQQNMHMQ